MRSVFVFYEQFVLGFFAALNVLYALFGYLGVRAVIVYARGLSGVGLKDLLERDCYKPISILIPAYNEEESIVGSVRSVLNLHHPEFEVVVACDGATDATLERLVEAFGLVDVPQVYRRQLETRPVRRVFRSVRHPNLVVIDKENGGTADALNAALNVARYPLVCAADADSLLDADALVRASRPFVEDDTVVGVGGTVRPLNGAVVKDGHVTELRVPSTWVERFQVLEYSRAFFTGRAAWSHFGSLLVVSGALGLFRRDAVARVGGWSTQTVTQDMELVVRLHRHYREAKIPYKILFTPDPICWTEVPSDLRSLRIQRNRWHRGLWETLWTHKRMLLNPRYGRLGAVGMPYFWFFEGIGPFIETLGYVMLILALVFDVFFLQFALLFLILAVLYGVLLSQLAMGVETLLLDRYPRLKDRALLFAASFLEFFGYRQILVLERCRAMFQVRRKRGHWGVVKRRGIAGQSGDGTLRPVPALDV